MYALAQGPNTLASTPTELQSSMSLPGQNRLVSRAKLETLDGQPSKQDGVGFTRSLSKTKTPSWVDSGTQPKIFPGIVHERTRRSSIRQGSGSDRDIEGIWPLVNASSLSRLAASKEDLQ